ncbi:MAG: hypothetical protein JO194_00995 [Candidatus Eremiobacteraeota bacterium]|nr:hypothetical protein [Candidatus Eremiobacteraeota bacterium]
MSPPLDPGVQGDLLRELRHEYPSLTQIPNGVLFSDPAKGRAMIIDQTHVEASENSPNVAPAALDRLVTAVRVTVPVIDFSPPYRVRVEGAGTVQALEGVNPAQVLLAHAPPHTGWGQIGGRCTHSCLRYLFTDDAGIQRDVHVEPLFAQPDKFYVMAVSINGSGGVDSLDDAMDQVYREVDVIERLGNRMVSDLVERA